MPDVSNVRPKIWREGTIIDLYDDGEYSAIWGARDDDINRSLGVRWNGSDGYVGYPNQGKNPVWYSEPEFLTKPILNALLAKVCSDKMLPRRKEFIKNILDAMEEN